MARILALVSADLIFQSKLQTAAAVSGAILNVLQDPAGLPKWLAEDWDVVVVDLDRDDIDALRALREIRAAQPKVPIVTYCSHVAVDRQAAAQAGGATAVYPRSAFVRLLPAIMAGRPA